MSEITKKKILIGARECLVREGHARSTIKRISEYAGVNHGLLHHYFGSKEELMVALFEQLTENMLKELFKNQPDWLKQLQSGKGPMNWRGSKTENFSSEA